MTSPREAHYSCENGSCSEYVSYPVNMLKEYKNKLWCEYCWGYDNPTEYCAEPAMDWSDLEDFVPNKELEK